MAWTPSGNSKLLILFIITLIVFGCAKSISPPGGPIDTIPPEIVSASPESRAIQVPLDSRIIIEFSENIDTRNVPRSLYITPQLVPDPKIKISGNRITIIPKNQLEPDVTYMITIGSDLKDAHNVQMEQSFSLAFSTGDIIDTGKIAGTVFYESETATGISIGLFKQSAYSKVSFIDSLAPDYITQCGSNGKYSFDYISPGLYHLIAFDDRNKNRRINPNNEKVGIPSKHLILDTANSQLDDINVQLNKMENEYLNIRSASINQDGMLKIRFTEPLSEYIIDRVMSNCALSPSDNKDINIEIKEYINLSPYPSPDFIALTELLTVDREYEIAFDRNSLSDNIPDSLRYVSYNFVYSIKKDISPPVLLETAPFNGEINRQPLLPFIFHFSEPIDSSGMAGAITISEDEDTISVSLIHIDGFTYNGKPDKMLKYSANYNLNIDGSGIFDRAGNKMSDTVKTISFITIGNDTLGQISGSIQFSPEIKEAYPVIVSFAQTDGNSKDSLRLEKGQLEFVKHLLPGYYAITSYMDKNNNNRYDYGSILPFALSEPFIVSADTIRVRSRFNSTGIILEF